MAQEPGPVTNGAAPDPRGGVSSPAVTSAEIRSQIEDTRAEMSQTIDAIQARLSPARLVTDATQTMKDATMARVRRLAGGPTIADGDARTESFSAEHIVNAVRRNPVPVALIGAAATALVIAALNGGRKGAGAVDRDPRERRLNARRSPRRAAKFLLGTCAAGIACWRTINGAAAPSQEDKRY